MDFDKVVESRHSVRCFKKGKKPNYKDLIQAIDAASKGPLAGNMPSLKYILIQDKKIITELAEACQQNFIGDAETLIAVCSDKNNLEKTYLKRGEIYSRQQAGAAIITILLKLVDLGLSSCWVGAFSDDMVKRILKVPENVNVEALLPVGYLQGKIQERKKPSLDSLLYFDSYKNENMSPRTRVAGSKV